ncbi:MAG: transketolase [Magnetococcales bacterium]|nr:transketolase [Magnetococcales bacterium]
MTDSALDQQCVATVRMLAAEAVEQANSGHPGMPLGAAPMAWALWSRFLRHDPAGPRWPGRDRFILSAGHGSALLYALLHLTGYELPLEELKNFRQWGSRTPGHPEYGHTPGVEATTGPLGQGFSMGVGMALAERMLAQEFNRPGHDVIDHHIYAIVSDGDLMEGVASEAASLAGHLNLGKLVYLYDDNRITIEGGTELAFTEDVSLRFAAYGWQVLRVHDGEDVEVIAAAIAEARADGARPSLIMVRTVIGQGSSKAGTSHVHGAPLGREELLAMRRRLGWSDEPFHIPEAVGAHTRQALTRGAEQRREWEGRLAAYRQDHPAEGARLEARLKGEFLPAGWDAALLALDFGGKATATRVASGKALNALAPAVEGLVGGSADLAPSNNTWLTTVAAGRNLRFGVREHAMAAMVNGMALHGGFLPYCATFLVFSDYMRGAMRLSAIMGTPVVYVLTHDSIAVGEDGPTHQPIEHLASLRAMPELRVIRPADAGETVGAWHVALTHAGPTCLILSRQNLAPLGADPLRVAQGAYVVSDPPMGDPELILLATGSEVELAMKSQQALALKGRRARVVSMPCWELFDEQSVEYRESVLPPSIKARVGIEAGASLGWHRWVGEGGVILALDRFGASAPGGEVMKRLGFSVENVVAQAEALLNR